MSEWLAALGLTQKRVPEESLPALLDLGKAQPDVREAILPVLGERGLWLAAQSPDWDYALGGDDAAAWQTGSLPIRLMLLQKLRRSDTTRARELMASTWPTDAPDERTAFLAACAINLGTDDEPFLEAALDDRRKEVRRMAADLLAQLPESRLCGRMLDRLRPLLTLTRGLKPNIEVTLPAECDKGMLRDGVEPKPPSGMGEKAWWLQQILGAVPPSIWSQTWRTSPKDLVQAAGRGEWRMMLLQGWAVAAMRQRDTEWIEALLADFLAHNELAQAQPAFEGLDDSRKEAFVLSLLHSNPSLQPMQLAYHFLLRCRHPWSVALSRAVLDSLQRHTSNGDIGPQFGWSPFLLEVARYMNPELIAEAESRLHEAAVSGIDAIDNFLNLLRFRYDMLKEIQP
ncbi:MAG TPA: DUF5691 domain-containing protein [Anaerolineae bacterium]|nr:DUF5691 domain-containing protein [Anaerolineae bacterium]